MAITITLPFDKKWTISEVHSDDPKLLFQDSYTWGITYYKTKSIYIDKELTKDHKIEVIRHEITHAVLFETQFAEHKKYSEEDICDFAGTYGKIICDLADKAFDKLNKEK